MGLDYLMMLLLAIVHASQKVGGIEPIISMKCPETRRGKARILLRSDMSVVASAKCKNGIFNFTRLDPVELELITTIADIVPGICQMWLYGDGYPDSGMNAKFGSTYTIPVKIGIGDYKNAIYLGKNRKNLLCNYNLLGMAYGNISSIVDVVHERVPPPMPMFHGAKIPNKITLEVLNVRCDPIRGGNVMIRRVIQLRATLHSVTKCIRALSCVAFNNVGSKYQLLTMGCGDGRIFRMNDGFTSHGNVTYSPYFRAFRLARSEYINFRCRFTVGRMKDCDHINSCHLSPGDTTDDLHCKYTKN